MKNTLLFAVITLFYACKSKEVLTPNRPPNAFTVTPTLKSDGKTIVLNWDKAKDPDGDAITYTVVLKDTLVKNISDTTYTITNLDFNYNQTGKVIAKDTKGLTTEVSFTATTKIIAFVNIPDANFEKYLVNNKIDKDGLVNGKMDIEDAKGVINLYPSQYGIKNITGIEVFKDLQVLSCFNNPLTTLDISKNINLKSLDCYNTQIKSLDVNTNVNLEKLVCGANQLTSLDMSKNLKLQELRCSQNQLTNLDVIKNIDLQYLSSQENNLENLDISKNINLKFLDCSLNQLTNLDVIKNIALNNLSCNNNFLKTLDVSKNIVLNNLSCSSNQLTNLDVGTNIGLIYLFCIANKLTNLDVTKNINLQQFWCFNNQIKIICVVDVAKAKGKSDWQKDPTATYEVCK